MKLRLFLLLGVLSLLIRPTYSDAQWAPDGNALCTSTRTQFDAVAAPDGAGGAIVAWADSRGGDYDIYAQRVNAWGAVQWTPNGVAVRAVADNQTSPAIVADVAGGAIIFWVHAASNGATDIYAQRLDAFGARQWSSNGVLICSAQHDQLSPRAVPDVAGGAVVTWQDNREGSNMVADVYAQRINSSGAVQWTTDGVAVCTAANAQTYARLAGDGFGGVIIAWSDYRDGVTHGVYARRINSAGVAQWAPDGIALGTDTGYEDAPAITTDGSGGAIVAWHAGVGDADVFAQRIDASGAVQWTGGGLPVCAADYHQTQPQIIADGAGGAIVTWMDIRDYPPLMSEDIYAQRVNASGVAQWTPDGVALCTAAGASIQPQIISDTAGGAVVSWIDTRTGDYNIYARRISGAGSPLWTSDGVSLCSATNSQISPAIVTDELGGAVVAWTDYRSGEADVYANRVTAGGAVPTAVSKSPSMASIVESNYPNPFSSTTAIEITLDHEADVNVEIFDVAGRRVRAVSVGHVGVGTKSFRFNGRDESGRLLPSGVYFCRVDAGNATATRKLVIQR